MTNRELFEQAYRRYHSGELPREKKLSPWLRQPQTLIMAFLVVLVLLVGILASLGLGKSASIAVTSEVVLCGGPAPGPCRVDSYGSCPPCVTTSFVRILSASGPFFIAQLRLTRGRSATTHLKPGTYRFELIGSGKHRSVVMQTKVVRVAAGGAAPIVKFLIPIS